MSRTRQSVTVGEQITTLLTGFTLTTAARELVSRFVEAEQQPAFPVLLGVLELEADARRARRVARRRQASKLPPGKTFDTLDEGRLPAALVRKLHELGEGDFVAEATARGLEVNPVKGADLDKLLVELYATPPAIIAEVKAIIAEGAK